MQVIGHRKFAGFFYSKRSKPVYARSSTQVRKGGGHQVTSFEDLAKKVATLQFLNREHVLLFRGQTTDWMERRSTILKPTIMRPTSAKDIAQGYRTLETAEKALVKLFVDHGLDGRSHIKRQRALRWSILQHYNVCSTPLLDFTQSLRVAASFATATGEEGFVYVVAVPSILGAVSVSADAGLQVIRLSSACPPSAMWPHFQEGYLLGEYPEISGTAEFNTYKRSEVDFGRRLIAKFRVNPKSLWTKQFPKIGSSALFPRDDLQKMLGILKLQMT